jgi:hypothetical protein
MNRSYSVPGWVWALIAIAIAAIVVVAVRRGRRVAPDEA